jgi:hypothetical protein
MSYLLHLAERALGRTENAIRPVLAPYFAPEAAVQLQGTRVRGLEETRSPATAVASSEATVGARSRQESVPPSGAVVKVSSAEALTGEKPVRISEPSLQSPPPRGALPAERGAVTDGVIARQPAPDARATGPGEMRVRAAEQGTMRYRHAQANVSAASRAELAQLPAESSPTVHIRIGRVEVRAVPAPQPALPEHRVASHEQGNGKPASTSLEAYLARPRGGGS